MTTNITNKSQTSTSSSLSQSTTPASISTGFTDKESQIKFSDINTKVSFKPTDDDAIDGQHFEFWAKRTKQWDPKDVTTTKIDKLINDYTKAGEKRKTRALHFIARKSLEVARFFSSGAKEITENITTGLKNYNNRRTQKYLEEYNFADDEDPKKSEITQIREKMQNCWQEYGKGKKIDIKDVVSMRIKTSLKDGKPDFTKECVFYVVVKEKNDDGSYKENAKGEIKTKIIVLHEGILDSEDITDCIVLSLNVLDWTNPDKWTFKAKIIKQDDPKAKTDSIQKTSTPDVPKQKKLYNTCYLHAAKALIDATKTKDGQAVEFAKPKEEREREAIEFAKEALKKDKAGHDIVDLDLEQDPHEVISRSSCFDSKKEEFQTKTEQFYKAPHLGGMYNDLMSTGAITTANTTILDVEVKPSLQESLDKFCQETDLAKLPESRDANGAHKITKKETLYTKKPPFLMLKVQRFNSYPALDENGNQKCDENGTPLPPETTKDNTLISVPEKLKLQKGSHLSADVLYDEVDFSLKGFIYHLGETTKSGHYITYIEKDDGKWYKFNSLDDNSNYGSEVTEAEEKDFDDRKKLAYMYLYTDPIATVVN
ncbi:MAG: ubiquitin carboxyl-terminal hydrolase family protein, partial [Parachlamydiales bacterium]|jgi:hypothetical protein